MTLVAGNIAVFSNQGEAGKAVIEMPGTPVEIIVALQAGCAARIRELTPVGIPVTIGAILRQDREFL